jgi:hypothetical protein
MPTKQGASVNEPARPETESALAELEAGRRAVEAAGKRGLPVLLTGWSTLVLLDYIAKDHVPDRRARLAISGTCAVATLAMSILDHGSNPIQPVYVGGTRPDNDAAKRLGATLLGWALAERALILGLRRSDIRWPNTLAGITLAIGRPLGYLGLRRFLTDTRSRG